MGGDNSWQFRDASYAEGAMCEQAVYQTTEDGLGQSTVVELGADPFNGFNSCHVVCAHYCK